MDGNLTQIEGYAYYTDPSRPGELTVHFDRSPFDAPYWVLALGDEDAVRAVPCSVMLYIVVGGGPRLPGQAQRASLLPCRSYAPDTDKDGQGWSKPVPDLKLTRSLD